jgi:hypothetical protein
VLRDPTAEPFAMMPTATVWSASMREISMFVATPPVQPSAPTPPAPKQTPSSQVCPVAQAVPHSPQFTVLV